MSESRRVEKTHTPGPWFYDGMAGLPMSHAKNDHGEPLLMVRGRGASVAEVIPQQNAEANARLIAKAPEMYALLQSLHERLMDGRNSVGRPTLESWAEEIDDLLTRVEGES